MTRVGFAWAATLGATLALPALPQIAPPAKPTFAAFTVKATKRDGQPVTPGKLCPQPDMENPQRISHCGFLGPIILEAYDPAFIEITGGTGWLGTDFFVIQATTDTPTDHATKMRMMQTLLEDRFQLKLRADKRDMSVLALVVVPGGPKFQPITPNGADNKPPVDLMEFSFRTMAELVSHLNKYSSFGASWRSLNGIDRPVLDETGLTGEYDGHFFLSIPANMMPYMAAHMRAEPFYPDVLKQQLGLELVTKTEPFTIYTIANVVEPADGGI